MMLVPNQRSIQRKELLPIRLSSPDLLLSSHARLQQLRVGNIFTRLWPPSSAPYTPRAILRGAAGELPWRLGCCTVTHRPNAVLSIGLPRIAFTPV